MGDQVGAVYGKKIHTGTYESWWWWFYGKEAVRILLENDIHDSSAAPIACRYMKPKLPLFSQAFILSLFAWAQLSNLINHYPTSKKDQYLGIVGRVKIWLTILMLINSYSPANLDETHLFGFPKWD